MLSAKVAEQELVNGLVEKTHRLERCRFRRLPLVLVIGHPGVRYGFVTVVHGARCTPILSNGCYWMISRYHIAGGNSSAMPLQWLQVQSTAQSKRSAAGGGHAKLPEVIEMVAVIG